jgi:DNA polymerase III subunit beta
MKFVVSSTELLAHLQLVGRVISNKNTLPILDNFLFNLDNNQLVITASDLESTLISKMSIENYDGTGIIALPAKILIDILKEFPEQPLAFEINITNLSVVLSSENGRFNIVGHDPVDFPQLPEIKTEKAAAFNVQPDVLLNGIIKTIFATADDELRPVMNGIFCRINSDHLTFAASDGHKLVRYRRTDITSEKEASYILPKKPASLLKNILPKIVDLVTIEFDDKNAFITLGGFTLICRLTEGVYPNFEAVIPSNNQNKMVIDRVLFFNSLRRVQVFSNQASNLVKLKIGSNLLTVSAQDLDYSISAEEKLNCQYLDEDIEIGFKSKFLIEILDNLTASEVVLEMADPARAGLVLPYDKENESEDILMLLMPMMVN